MGDFEALKMRHAERRAEVARFHAGDTVWCCSQDAEKCFDDCELLLARLASAEEALRPFAEMAGVIGNKAGDEACWVGQSPLVIRYGDLRKAAAHFATAATQEGK